MTRPLFPDDEITQLAGLRETTGQLERRPAPPAQAASAISPTRYLPFAPGLVVAHRENAKRYPGGWRVVPVAGWNSGGTTFAGLGFARLQVKHDQVAANYAAAADTIVGAQNTWDLEVGRVYDIYVGFRAAAAVLATGHINLEAGGTNVDFSTSLGTSARYALARMGSKSFTAGQTITIRAYHTTASAGDIEIDQLYFVPTGLVYDETVGTGLYGDRTALETVDLVGNLNLATSGVTTPADTTFPDVGSAITDTQQIAWLWDSTMRPSAWHEAVYAPDDLLIAAYGSVDFERRNPRHVYVQARAKKDTAEGDDYQKGGHLTLVAGGGKHETANVQSTCAGFYYLGLINWYIHPVQFVLWRNTDFAANNAPWPTDVDGSLIDDVRVARALFSSSILDDH